MMIRAISRSISLRGTLFALVILLVTSSAYIAFRTRMSAPEIATVDLEQLPYQLGDWKGTDSVGLSAVARDILQLDHALRRTYRRPDGGAIDLYIGYWQRQSGEHQAAKHSPAVCLPSNGWNTWDRQMKQVSYSTSNTVSAFAANSMSGQFAHQNYLFYYWFFSGDRTYANEWTALFFITLEKFLKNRSDGGIVELSTPVVSTEDGATASQKQADTRLSEFSAVLYPALMNLIRTSESVSESKQPQKAH